VGSWRKWQEYVQGNDIRAAWRLRYPLTPNPRKRSQWPSGAIQEAFKRGSVGFNPRLSSPIRGIFADFSPINESQIAAVAAALERGFGIDPSPKLVAALKDAMRDCGSFTLVAAGCLERARARRAAIPVQGPPPPVDVAEARDDGAAVAVPINRSGKTQLFTLEDLDKATGAYRIVTERVQAIIDEEFGGEVTIRHVFRRPDRAASIRFVAASGRVGQRRTGFYFFFRFRHRFV